RLRRRRAVEDPGSLELHERGNVEPLVRNSHREDDGARLNFGAARDRYPMQLPLALDARDLAGEEERRAEHPGLLVRTLGELGAAEPAREPEVVADPRAGARLTPDGLALDDERRKPL